MDATPARWGMSGRQRLTHMLGGREQAAAARWRRARRGRRAAPEPPRRRRCRHGDAPRRTQPHAPTLRPRPGAHNLGKPHKISQLSFIHCVYAYTITRAVRRRAPPARRPAPRPGTGPPRDAKHDSKLTGLTIDTCTHYRGRPTSERSAPTWVQAVHPCDVRSPQPAGPTYEFSDGIDPPQSTSSHTRHPAAPEDHRPQRTPAASHRCAQRISSRFLAMCARARRSGSSCWYLSPVRPHSVCSSSSSAPTSRAHESL